jgi:hypothetical protein
MRVGFITQLLWSRYGELWTKLVAGVDAEPVLPEVDRVMRAMNDRRLEGIPGTAFKLAAAQAIALQDTDLIIAPELNPNEESTIGGGQDPWIASFPEALATSLSGLPSIAGVPAALDGTLETVAVNTLHGISRDASLVRRAWERNRSLTRPTRQPEPRWEVRPSERETAGLIGQPWLLSDLLSARVASEERHVVSQHQLERVLLREEGRRVDARLIGTDAEVVGAARFLGRKGSVTRLVMILDRSSGSDLWLRERIERVVHKPMQVQFLDEVLEPEALLEHRLAR